jgi:hypothetical protein
MRFVMTANQMRGLVAAAVIVLGAGALGRVSGQTQPAAAAERRSGEAGVPENVLPALLAEVKGLRAAMEQMSSAGPRVQLFVGRLQLQETRMNGMIRRLDTVRDTLGTARRDLDRAKGALKMLQGPPEPGVPQDGLGPMINGMKQEVAAAQGTVDRLAGEEAQLTQDLTVEQGRWIDINQRLDELERALAKR